MIKSPIRFFFSASVILAAVGFVLCFVWSIAFFPQDNRPSLGELGYARFLVQTGQLDAALEQYESIQDESVSAVIKTQASAEQSELLNMQIQQPLRIAKSQVIYILWYITPKILILSLIFFLCWIIFLGLRILIKQPQIAFLPVYDISTQNNIGEKLPQLIRYRARELSWKYQNLSASKMVLSETLDVPTMGLLNDGDSVDITGIIETALMFSGGSSNLPLARIILGISLWLQQPRHLIRCEIKKMESSTILRVLLLDGYSQSVEKFWSVKIDNVETMDMSSQIVDTLLFILIHHFGKKISAQNWESLQALCNGLERLQDCANTQMAKEHLNQAKIFFEKALELDRDYVLSLYNLGLVFLRQGDYDNARNQFKKVMVLSQDNKLREYGTYSYGASLLQLSQEWAYLRAIDTFLDLAKNSRNREIIDIARSALALTRVKLAERDKEHKDELIQAAQMEIHSIKHSKFTPLEALALAFSAEGYCNIITDNIPEAIQSFSQALLQDPKNVSALIGLGNAYFKDNQKEKAIETYIMAENLSPASGYPGYKLGSFYQDIGDMEKAVKAYERSANFTLSRLALGKLFLLQGKHEQALENFQQAVIQNKKLSEGWVNIAWTICEINTNDPNLIKEAEESARRALQLEQNPDQLWHRHCVLSRVYLLANKTTKALGEAKKAVELSHLPQAYYFLALIENELGNKENAKVIGKKILELGDREWILKFNSLGLLDN